ncbi:MAG: hypothetical protein LBH47_03095 [Christensenellaceae bacterium]|nr:hypothetical protein [Christensenellaceae bacterium]
MSIIKAMSLFAVVLSFFLFALFAFTFLLRDKYFSFSFRGDRVEERIVKLPIRRIKDIVLRGEVKIFNGLNLVMECRGGVAVAFINQIQELLERHDKEMGVSSYERLFYCYANYILYLKTLKRVFRLNVLRGLFQDKILRIIKDSKLTLGERYYCYPQSQYKVFKDTAVKNGGLMLPSCIFERGDIEIRRYENFIQLFCEKEGRYTLEIAEDKYEWDCEINRCRILCRNLTSGEKRSYKIRGETFRLGTSIGDKSDRLKVYLVFAGKIEVSINGGEKVLLKDDEIEFNKKCEAIIRDAMRRKYILGLSLRENHKIALKLIPTLHLLTMVFEITTAEDFVRNVDNFPYYKKIAKLFGGFNVIFLYGSNVNFANDLVDSFINENDIDGLLEDKVYIYFIDRVTAAAGAIYILSKMLKPKYGLQHKFESSGKGFYSYGQVTVNEIVGKSLKTIILQNTSKKMQTVNIPIGIDLGKFFVVSKKGNYLIAANLFGTASNYKKTVYKLPEGCRMDLTEELITDYVEIKIKAKLMGYEQKKYVIAKNKDGLSLDTCRNACGADCEENFFNQSRGVK